MKLNVLNASNISQDINAIATWYFRKYLLKYKKLELTIQLNNIKEYGLCFKLSKYQFLLDISNELSGQNLICAVLHELVHVKQYLKRELSADDSSVYWHNVEYADVDYDLQPWEIEARNSENYLIEQYNYETDY